MSIDPFIARLSELAGCPIPESFRETLLQSVNPDRSMVNLERWLSATSNPPIQCQALLEDLTGSGRMLFVLGASQHLADVLIQNPELASLFFDSAAYAKMPTVEGILNEGRRLLTSSISLSHSLDRLRFVKQSWLLSLAAHDLEGSWEPEAVWRGLSNLADALIILATETNWNESRKGKEPSDSPVAIVAFGKLGGSELNYSSDIDLVYVVPDGLSDEQEKEATKFAEAVGRSFAQRMGRGNLYRVDLRLRPYGGTGAILRSISSMEGYYERYAEPWEVQALLRSRIVVGTEEIRARWLALVREKCFPPRLNDFALEQMLLMRGRIEELSTGEDLKRGAGGIRDVEFLTQVMQMLHGQADPKLQVMSTLEGLEALEGGGYLDHAVARSLREGYIYLRQLEHRCQLVGDQQTHHLPDSAERRNELAKLMGEPDWTAMMDRLDRHRRTIQTLYRAVLQTEPKATDDRSLVAERLGANSQAALQWFDIMPESEAFYESLAQNEGSLERVRRIIEFAPKLVSAFRDSVPLTELLLSGEIEEDSDAAERIRKLPLDTPMRTVASSVLRGWTAILAVWTLGRSNQPGKALAELYDAVLDHCARRLYIEFDIIGLGSYGICELSPTSDADCIFLVPENQPQLNAESQAQAFLSLISQLGRYGSPVEIDLRLRPEGRKGLLARTYHGLKQYDLDGMEMWERMALCQARLVRGNPEALQMVQKMAYALPLTPDRLKELVAMKRRIEAERVSPHHSWRNVKLGNGGLSDLEWFVHLFEMRYPTATRAGQHVRIPDRIRALGRATMLNAVEVEEMLEAHDHLLSVRLQIGLLGLTPDIVPENPDRLDRLAHALGLANGNAFLAVHEKRTSRVREIYLDGLERLRA